MGRSRELGAISNPSMEEKASNSDSDSDSYSSSENCPVLLGQNSDRMRKLCGSLYGVSTDRPQWEQYRRSTDFLSTGPVCRRLHHAGPHGSKVVRSSPGPQLQPVPARRGLHHAGPAFADVHPMFADVCIRSPNVCRRLHTFTQCLPTSASCWPGRR
jgi:hypothetical protein